LRGKHRRVSYTRCARQPGPITLSEFSAVSGNGIAPATGNWDG